MTIKNATREVNLSEGQYRVNVFKYFLDKINEPKIFISSISFARNLIEYSEDNKCDDYIKLTSCLHLKSDSSIITADDTLNVFKARFDKTKSKTITFAGKNIIDLIFETADAIIAEQDINEILLENKIVLAIAIRLKAERFMIKALPSFDLINVNSNQTRALFDEYKKTFQDNKEKLMILDKVNLMTPENIHLNAFMYEPLIDIALKHLIDLYNGVSLLTV
jgi:hypothetical protein